MSDNTYKNLQDQIGDTRLCRVQRLLPENTSNTILCKLEGDNPAGSVKDRPAFNMICLLYTSPSPRDS